MTIIQPNKHKDIKKLSISLGILLVSMLSLWVFVYLETVNLNHNIVNAKSRLESIKVENADLKDKYYGLVDADNLEKLAIERGLVKDKNPQWAFESQQ